MILVLNFSTLSPVSYNRKEEKHCLSNLSFPCASISWSGPFPLSNNLCFQDMHVSGIVKDCASAVFLVAVLSAV